LDIIIYEKITDALENYALYQLMEENKNDKKLSLEYVKKYYQSLQH